MSDSRGAIKLQVRNIGLSYYLPRTRTSLVALGDVSFDVQSGEFVSVVGPSGCGKTTLLNVVDGLIKATQGTIVLDGRVVTDPGTDRSMVFQEAALLPWRTVLKNVTYGLECQRVPKREAEATAHKLIELVGLKGFADAYPHELSGGMQQRVNLARALAVDPSVLLMDEPFAALDAQTREFMQAELLRIWNRTRKTVLFVTHQIDEAVYLSDRVVVLSQRPSKVREIITVDIPRPRNLSVKRSPEFLAYVDRVWSLIRVEAESAAQAQASEGPVAR